MNATQHAARPAGRIFAVTLFPVAMACVEAVCVYYLPMGD